MLLAVEDLKKDTANINTMVKRNHILIKGLDLLLVYSEFEKLVPEGNNLDKNDPALFLKYHDDILYYETTLTNLTNIVANHKLSSDSICN